MLLCPRKTLRSTRQISLDHALLYVCLKIPMSSQTLSIIPKQTCKIHRRKNTALSSLYCQFSFHQHISFTFQLLSVHSVTRALEAKSHKQFQLRNKYKFREFSQSKIKHK